MADHLIEGLQPKIKIIEGFQPSDRSCFVRVIWVVIHACFNCPFEGFCMLLIRRAGRRESNVQPIFWLKLSKLT